MGGRILAEEYARTLGNLIERVQTQLNGLVLMTPYLLEPDRRDPMRVMTSDQRGYSKYTFRDQTGYIVAPWIPGIDHEWVLIRHSASVQPWVDRDTHFHSESEEYYLVFQGELRLLVDGSVFTLRSNEALSVRPEVPHCVIGGTGPIEHFVLRMPGVDDRQSEGEIPLELPLVIGEAERQLQLDWGCRVPLTEPRYQNCWLFGVGQARFHSDLMCLAYLSFPTEESVEADRHPHRLHLHQQSWEYYTVLQGKRVLRVEDELVEIDAGEILEVAPGTRHVLCSTRVPFEGFTFRVPRLDDKVEF
jgi:mannose-6-phosphate isomerase-like protein (cupin superfamily)